MKFLSSFLLSFLCFQVSGQDISCFEWQKYRVHNGSYINEAGHMCFDVTNDKLILVFGNGEIREYDVSSLNPVDGKENVMSGILVDKHGEILNFTFETDAIFISINIGTWGFELFDFPSMQKSEMPEILKNSRAAGLSPLQSITNSAAEEIPEMSPETMVFSYKSFSMGNDAHIFEVGKVYLDIDYEKIIVSFESRPTEIYNIQSVEVPDDGGQTVAKGLLSLDEVSYNYFFINAQEVLLLIIKTSDNSSKIYTFSHLEQE